MDERSTCAWFDRYVATLARCGRGESDDLDALLDYYRVPLVVATDDAAVTLMTAPEVTGFAGQQVSGMRASGYDHTDVLDGQWTSLNATSALYRVDLARRRGDGSEIGRLRVTYLITDGAERLGIAALAVHSA